MTTIINNLIYTFLALVVFAGILPALNLVIANATAEADAMTGLLLRFIPLVIVVLIVAGIFSLRDKRSEYYQEY